jgi:hypothetical protein
VEGKPKIQKRFLDLLKLHTSPLEARAAFPDLAAVIDTVT